MDLYDRFEEYLKTMQSDIPMSVLIFQATTVKGRFLCVPFDYAIFEQTRSWGKAIPKSFHINSPTFLQKVWIKTSGRFYYGIPVQFEKPVIRELYNILNEATETDQFSGFLNFQMGREIKYPIRLVMAHKDKHELLPFLKKAV